MNMVIGDFIIRKDPQKDFVWIGTLGGGEGGLFPVEQVEAIIRKFYEDNF